MRFLPLSDWQTEQKAFEIRYEPAYRMWDASGGFTDFLSHRIPLKVREAQPGTIQATVTGGKLAGKAELRLELERAVVLCFTEDDGEFGKLVAQAVEAVQAFLGVEKYERVGLRHTRAKPFSDTEQAMEEMARLKVFNPPPDGRFGIKAQTPASLEFGVRWEAGSLGAKCTLSNVKAQITLEVVPAHSRYLKPKDITVDQFRLDLDYYTLKPMNASALQPVEWMSQAERMGRRDLPKFLE